MSQKKCLIVCLAPIIIATNFQIKASESVETGQDLTTTTATVPQPDSGSGPILIPSSGAEDHSPEQINASIIPSPSIEPVPTVTTPTADTTAPVPDPFSTPTIADAQATTFVPPVTTPPDDTIAPVPEVLPQLSDPFSTPTADTQATTFVPTVTTPPADTIAPVPEVLPQLSDPFSTPTADTQATFVPPVTTADPVETTTAEASTPATEEVAEIKKDVAELTELVKKMAEQQTQVPDHTTTTSLSPEDKPGETPTEIAKSPIAEPVILDPLEPRIVASPVVDELVERPAASYAEPIPIDPLLAPRPVASPVVEPVILDPLEPRAFASPVVDELVERPAAYAEPIPLDPLLAPRAVASPVVDELVERPAASYAEPIPLDPLLAPRPVASPVVEPVILDPLEPRAAAVAELAAGPAVEESEETIAKLDEVSQQLDTLTEQMKVLTRVVVESEGTVINADSPNEPNSVVTAEEKGVSGTVADIFADEQGTIIPKSPVTQDSAFAIEDTAEPNGVFETQDVASERESLPLSPFYDTSEIYQGESSELTSAYEPQFDGANIWGVEEPFAEDRDAPRRDFVRDEQSSVRHQDHRVEEQVAVDRDAPRRDIVRDEQSSVRHQDHRAEEPFAEDRDAPRRDFVRDEQSSVRHQDRRVEEPFAEDRDAPRRDIVRDEQRSLGSVSSVDEDASLNTDRSELNRERDRSGDVETEMKTSETSGSTTDPDVKDSRKEDQREVPRNEQSHSDLTPVRDESRIEDIGIDNTNSPEKAGEMSRSFEDVATSEEINAKPTNALPAPLGDDEVAKQGNDALSDNLPTAPEPVAPADDAQVKLDQPPESVSPPTTADGTISPEAAIATLKTLTEALKELGEKLK
jgi:hypothetical protein